MIVRPHPPRRVQRPGFTLVLTVLLLAALVLTCVGVLTLARQDLGAARAQAHGVRAELGVNGALADAEATLLGALREPGVVVGLLATASGGEAGLEEGDPGPQDVAIWNWDGTRWRPTVLGSGLEADPMPRPWAGVARPAWGERDAVEVPLWSRPGVRARAQWLEPEGQGPRANARPGEARLRYAWWVEDLAGLADLAALERPDPSAGSRTRGTELPLYGLFRPQQGRDDLDDGPEDRLLDARRQLGGSLVVADAELLLRGDADSQRRLRRLAWADPAGVAAGRRETETIPVGLGYALGDEPVPKADLNALLAARDVDGIAAHIARHLPQFADRRGAFPPDQDYLKTLAANLIDYADADSDATVGPTYRGVDSMPFVNEFYIAYHWINEGEGVPSGATAGPREVVIEGRTFVELWNPSDQPIEGEVGLRLDNRRTIQNLPGAFGERVMRDLAVPTSGEIDCRPVRVSLPPNGFAVIEFVAASDGRPPRYRHEVPAGWPAGQVYFSSQARLNPNYNPADPTGPGARYLDSNNQPVPTSAQAAQDPVKRQLVFPSLVNSASRWTLSWNGVPVDLPRGGFQQSDGVLESGWGSRKWKGVNGPALDLSLGQFGDPRMSWYIQDTNPADAVGYIYAGNYDQKTSWGGRTDRRNPGRPYDQVLPSLWPDGGPNSQAGQASGTDARMPNRELVANWKNWPQNVAQFRANESLRAPVHIADYPDGRLLRVTEWGQVFDPAQWQSPDGRSYGGGAAFDGAGVPTPANWNATPTPQAAAGGGATLAVGRPEFAAFRRDGWRAAQLLDLFSIHAGAVRPLDGVINLNTAPKEVLQMLFAGVMLDLDPNQAPLEAARRSAAFADAIVAWRAGRGSSEGGGMPGPFISRAELAQLASAPGADESAGSEGNPGARAAWFGNPARSGLPAAAEFAWTDAGREELFGMIYEMIRTDSRAFRIHAVAEVYQVLPGGGERLLARRTRLREVVFEDEAADPATPRCRTVAERPL